jgi:hypothetical protein
MQRAHADPLCGTQQMLQPSRDVFRRVPEALWVCILAFVAFSPREGRALHAALARVSRAARHMTQHELVWRARFVVMLSHLGFAEQTPQAVPRAPTSAPPSPPPFFAGHGCIRNGDDACALAATLRLRLARPEPAARDTPCVRAETAASALDRPPEQRARVDPRDAPVAFAMLASAAVFPSTLARVQYLFAFVSKRCCACFRATVRDMAPAASNARVRAGLEFLLPASSATRVCARGAGERRQRSLHDDETPLLSDSNANATDRASDAFVEPWCGLRICCFCVVALNLTCDPVAAAVSPKDASDSLGLVVPAPNDFGHQVPRASRLVSALRCVGPPRDKFVAYVAALPDPFSLRSRVRASA